MVSTPEPKPKNSPYDRWRPAEKVEWVPRDLRELRFARRFLLEKGYTRAKVAGFLEFVLNLQDPLVQINTASRADYRKMLVALSEVPTGNPGPATSAHDAGSAIIAAVVGTATVMLTALATRRPELLALPPIIHDPVNPQVDALGALQLAA